MRLNSKKVLLFIYAFVLIYQPNFSYLIKIDNHVLCFALVFAYCFKYLLKRDSSFTSTMKKKSIIVFILFCVFATTYRCYKSAMNLIEFSEVLHIAIQGLFPIVYLLGAVTLNMELNKLDYSAKEKIKFIINIAIFQGIISFLMLIVPSLKQIAINIYYKGGPATNFYITQNRLHGICDGDYTYGFQILHSLFALITLCYAYYYKEKKYYAAFLLVFLVTILNGRSGILMFFIGLILILLNIIRKKNGILKLIIIIPIGLCIFTILLALIKNGMPNTYALMSQAVRDISKTLNGDTNTETGSLMSMLVFPAGSALLFGRGFRIYGFGGREFGYFLRSDIGYVNDLFIGGMLYMFLLYLPYIYLYKISKRHYNSNSFERMILFLTLMVIFISNVKGEAFRQPLLISNFIMINVLLLPVELFGKSVFEVNDYETSKI